MLLVHGELCIPWNPVRLEQRMGRIHRYGQEHDCLIFAKALLDAYKQGVKILAVLDKSNQTDKYSAATFLANAGIPVLIDAEHAIAHNKVIVIDDSPVLTGSFNFSKAAEEKNAENLLVLKKAPELANAYMANINAHAAHAHPYQRTTAEATPERKSGTSGGDSWDPEEQDLLLAKMFGL
jgi:phosphatidylserine/phosphatidylglycerophosphate/cardiolipin synthase-like enzyme